MSKSVKAALTANALVAFAKTAGAFATGSASMMAESIHSLVDCTNQLLLLFGQSQSTKKTTKDHPFGHGKESYFWSFLVAVLLFTLGGVFSIYEGVLKLAHGEQLHNTWWAVGIILFSIFVESRSLKVCLEEIRHKHPNKSLFWFFKETRDTNLLIVLGEDAAALTGLLAALFFLFLAIFTGNSVWDAIGSIFVGLLLCFVAIGLFIETKALLIGQSVAPDTRMQLYQFLSRRSEIEHTYDCLTLQMGQDALLLIRARMTEKEDAAKLIDDINRVESDIKAEFPQFEWIFFEPDNLLDAD